MVIKIFILSLWGRRSPIFKEDTSVGGKKINEYSGPFSYKRKSEMRQNRVHEKKIQVEYLNMSEPYHYGIMSSQSNTFIELDCRHS